MTVIKSLVALGIACLTPFAAAAADPQMVVIAVTGELPQYKVGQKIDAVGSLNLPAGTSVRLLSANGQVIALTGPHTGPAAAPARTAGGSADEQAMARLSKFLGERQVQSRALGTMRSGPPRTHEPTDVWMVVVGDREHQCARGSRVTLWRKIAETDSSLEIISAGTTATRLSWSKGANAIDLPPAFTANKSTFELKVDGVPSKVTLHLAPAALQNPVMLADWMVREKCDRQATLFLNSLQ